MNNKQRKILQDIFKKPTSSDIRWDDIEMLFKYLDAEVLFGRGSRIRVKLNGAKSSFHRPHPRKTADKGTVLSIKRFLECAGVKL